MSDEPPDEWPDDINFDSDQCICEHDPDEHDDCCLVDECLCEASWWNGL